jgi:hypothetical protein
MRVRRAFSFFSALLVMGGGLALITVPVQAVDYTWDGGGDATSWSDPLNWDLDSSFPGPADNAIFRDHERLPDGHRGQRAGQPE